MLTELPDLSKALPLAAGTAYRAFERFDVVALPTRLLLDIQADGQPTLRVSKIRGGQTPTATRGQLDVGFTVDADLRPVADELVARRISGRLLRYEADGAVLRVATTDHRDVISVIGAEHNPSLGASFDLDADTATLITDWVRDRQLPFLDVALRLRIKAVAGRHSAQYRFDPHAVATALAARLGAGANVSPTSLAEVIDDVLHDAGADMTREIHAPDAEKRDEALALRLITMLTTPADTIEPLYGLRPAQDVPTGIVSVDLDEPAPVWLDTILSLDRPAAEAALAQADLTRVLANVDLPTLSFGRRTVAASANLTYPVAGLLMLLADLRAEARPPVRPQAVSGSAELTAPRYTATVDLDLAPGEKLDADVRLRALLDTGGGVEEVTGPWHRTTDDWALLGPNAFPTPVGVVRISPSLAELATVEISTPTGRIVATLDGQSPIGSIPLWPDGSGFSVALRPKSGGLDFSFPLDPGVRLELAPEMLPGFGVHSATLTLSPGGGAVSVQWRREGAPDTETQTVLLTPATPTAELNWIATTPFQPGVVWRIADGQHAWSVPIAPRDDLVIEIPGGA